MFVFTRLCGTDRRSEFDPIGEVRSQGCPPRHQSVVVVRPVSNLAVVCAHDRGPVHRDWNLPREPAVERLCQCSLQCPFSDHVIATYENCVSQKQRVWVKFLRLLEEFTQALFVLKL